MQSHVNYNERSWAIDLISEINSITSTRNLRIKKAGGEYTLSTEKNPLFPDVLLFADSSCQSILQGWELKLPDTPITDNEFIENATKKALYLNLNSFLLWNAKETALYCRSEDNTFKPIKHWITPEIRSRQDVRKKSYSWKKALNIILEDLDSFLEENKLEVTDTSYALSSNIYNEFLERYVGIQSDYLKKEATKDNYLEAKIDRWYSLHKNEFKNYDKFHALANEQIILWLNRFFFTNYLKFFNENVMNIDKLNHEYSLEEGLILFKKISQQSGLTYVYNNSLGFKVLSNEFWSALVELNQLLVQINFKDYADNLEKIIVSALEFASKKTAGQYATPIALAEYLVSVTMRDKNKDVIDPCCGSGTIAKKAYDLKTKSGIPCKKAMNTTWASDLFSSSLHLSTIRLFEPRCIEESIQVFQGDALKILAGDTVHFINPIIEKSTQKKLPKFHSIVSNLPFVRFEDFGEFNDVSGAIQDFEERYTIRPDGKSDLYEILLLKLRDLVHDEGRIGFILSNSWLGTKAGKKFRDLMLIDFKIKNVITSGSGRWFEPKVVTTILILEPKDRKSDIDLNKDKISFVTTMIPICDWKDHKLPDLIQGTILDESIEDKLRIQKYSIKEINDLESLGLNWNALFTNNNWLLKIKNKLDKVANHFEISRGHRRGWDKMFYPDEGHNIEAEYLRPLVKSPKDRKPNSLLLKSKGVVFSCNESLDNLKRNNKKGALDWIEKFKYSQNTAGKPLTESLKKTNLYWYQHDNEPLDNACLVMSINPDKKLNTYKVDSDCILNQRLTKLIRKNPEEDYELLHALLNSSVSMFLLECIGFPRGLGALDTSSTNIKDYLCMLNPNMLNNEKKLKILEAFKPLTIRDPLDLPLELESIDRVNFDDTIIDSFHLDCKREEIYSSLLLLFNKRQTVRD